MQSISLVKQPGHSSRSPLKAYDVTRNGETVGTLQTWGTSWEVYDVSMCQVSRHSTIKAAVRVAGRLL